jgi:hypothetical protein
MDFPSAGSAPPPGNCGWLPLDFADDLAPAFLMHVAVTGATGMVGTALARALRTHGHEVLAVSRRQIAGGIRWDPERRSVDVGALAAADAVVHLAGENLASGRWTARRKEQLRESRVAVTRWLAETLAAARAGPRLLISASAVGIYGNRGDEVLTEGSSVGNDFLARLASDWEAAADPARHAGIRVVHPRFGMILSPAGGALARLLPPFRLGLGGPFGNGRQWISWITIDDVVSAIEHALVTDSLSGPANFAAPQPVRNVAFARALGDALHRPAVIPLPAIALRLALGEMAEATVLASHRATPARLRASGYQFKHSEILPALHRLLAPE